MAGILITGATGFVGTHLVEAIARNGLRARALVRETSDTGALRKHGIERVVGDLTDPAALRRAVRDADTVLHLAAATRSLAPAGFHAVNAEGTGQLVRAMTEAGGGRLVYLSSLAAVGPRRDRPVRPDDPPRPLTVYGSSKLEGERRVRSGVGVSSAILRAPAVYGPGDRDLLPFFRLANRGVLPVIGSLERQLQLVHVRDLARAILAAARSSATGVFHIAEPRAYTWAQVLELMATAVDRPGTRVRVPDVIMRLAATASEAAARIVRRAAIFDRDKARELLAPGWTCETDVARRAFGFEASTPLADGLRETADWYRNAGWLPKRGRNRGR
ncbi:MAG TPA: NAD-dependent epimerase/dehydratase family protein [Longimicrobiales bacterium]|nr:NAD-dependent epimerase/dehydratase family protein [Longimicrobiales bacterium]